MTHVAFPDSIPTNAESLASDLESREIQGPPDFYDDQETPDNAPIFKCDWCSKGVPFAKNARVAHYMADGVVYENNELAETINQRGQPALLATFCEDCSLDRLLFPCEGYAEFRFRSTMTETGHENVEFTDVSGPDDGIPWDPAHVIERLFELPRDAHNQLLPDMLSGPENVVMYTTAIDSATDIRELVNYDGSLDEKQLGRARKRAKEFVDELRAGGTDQADYRKRFDGR